MLGWTGKEEKVSESCAELNKRQRQHIWPSFLRAKNTEEIQSFFSMYHKNPSNHNENYHYQKYLFTETHFEIERKLQKALL